jgi:hypothetical protein
MRQPRTVHWPPLLPILENFRHSKVDAKPESHCIFNIWVMGNVMALFEVLVDPQK